MGFAAQLTEFLSRTQESLWLFSPGLVLCITVVVLLLARLFDLDRRVLPSYFVAIWGTALAFLWAWIQFRHFYEETSATAVLFNGMLVFDRFTAIIQLGLLLFLVLTIALTVLTGIPDQEDGPDFYTLLIGSVLGMLVMTSANHFLMLFLGVEMASVPSYAMVGFLKGRRQSSEAALKFVVYGAGAAGVMLYGLSLLAGLTGTAELGSLADRLVQLFATPMDNQQAMVPVVALAILMIMVGFAFKLSLVPFHFWCPDAFHGASAEVAGFLSVASKAGAFALLVRFSVALTKTTAPLTPAIGHLALYLGIGLAVIAMITTTFGNLAAYGQTNLKRLFAYSTIAHAGYMLMAVAALLVLQSSVIKDGADQAQIAYSSRRAIEGLIYYLAVYLFMNLGVFAIIALIRNQLFSEELDAYRGLAWQAPLLGICMALCCFSLVGLPPFGGFFGKLAVFAAVYDASHVHWIMWTTLVVGGLNTALSLYYYVRVLKVMIIEVRPEGAPVVKFPAWSNTGLYLLIVTAPVLALGVFVQNLSEYAFSAADGFFPH